VLQTYRVSDGFLLNTLVYNSALDGSTEGGDGVDWHPTQNLLVAAKDKSIPVYDLDTGAPLGTTTEGTVLILTPATSLSEQQLTFPRSYHRTTISQTYFKTENDYVPAFSPNGQQVAYVRADYIQDGNAPYPYRQPSILALRMINTDGSSDHQVLSLPQGIYVTHVSWSRDGTQLVFDAGQQYITNGTPYNIVDSTTEALYIVNTNGTGLRSLRAATAGFPVWSPAGTTFCNLPGVVVPGGVAGSASIDDCGPPLTLSAGRTQSGQFRVDITGGTDNLLYRVLASPDLTGWQSMGTTPRSGTTTSFDDTNGSNLPRRFYRVVLRNN